MEETAVCNFKSLPLKYFESSTTITVAENGPLMVSGSFEMTDQNGNKEVKTKAAFCRCGASNNKPYCDGLHVAASFKG